MAIEDALQAILDDWAQVEPLMTVSELAELASVGWGTMRGAESASGPEPERDVFAIISAALPAAHPAWAALAARSGAAADSQPTLELDLIDLAGLALDDPRSSVDESADSLAQESLSALLRAEAVPVGPGLEVPQDWLSVRVGGQLVVPAFQFAGSDTSRQYEAVAALAEQLCAREDPAGAIAWWLTPNPWLSARPADLLGTEREPELAYAADQLANDSW
ncbi:MAG TPA: hypothetical protein VFI65_02915 [Streptosporangiaceae bacterium]|nr:hypothetical protein [Streptosporangiaceae bacterium]